ncbi:MAG TPA: SusC/RagA family TonB-linked outer membrane protein [Longimicrobiaceae bacterium]|nr:SusC/RagA family TonB-linked outer membrane protein [Longimicrobiaceae bacterium]
MRLSRWLTLALLAACAVPRAAAAQATGTIQGTVVDATTRQPLVGARVTVQGTVLSAASDAQGHFRLTGVPAGSQTVRAEMLGYTTADAAVTVQSGATVTTDFSLSQSALQLQGLVVTALGIERQQRSLGVATEQVSGQELSAARDPNLVSALSGKVAGVTITNSNTAGGSARIVIRGAGSLTGNNQPLFVVDGIPVDNSAPGLSGATGYNAIDYGNTIQDLNPSDIESISVLKGPNAAALYGSRAANGAVIITTRNGAGVQGGQVQASMNVSFETPLKLPDYQNLYGQGHDGEYSYVNGRGSGVFDDMDESWGPRLDGRLIPQFFSGGQAVPWVAHPNNVRGFFETGRTVNTNASFATNGERGNARLSVSNLTGDGMYPGFGQRRTTLALNGTANLSSKLRAEASAQYINSDAHDRPAQGYGEFNPMWQFLWFGRQVDISKEKETLRNEDGSQFHWNNRWSNNPYFNVYENHNADKRDRVIGSASITYDFTPWLRGMVRSGTDWYQTNRRTTYAAGTLGLGSGGENGSFGEDNIFNQETNTDFLLTATLPKLRDFAVTLNGGGSRRDNSYRSNSVYAQSLVVPGLYDLGNAASTPSLDDWREATRVNSLYAFANIGYRDFLYLDVTGRNDWSSTLPAGNNSYFYPSVAGSLIFSELTHIPGISYGKLRASWAQVGNDADVYQLVDPYLADTPFDGVPRYTASNRLRNFNLKPEMTRSWEVGTELAFLDDRLGVDATYYHKVTSNQIIPIQISPMTGFTERMLNAGEISNRGVEMMVNATPVRLANGLEWNVTANYGKNTSRVDELYGDLENIVLGTYYGVSVEAHVGEPYGAMYGRKYVRDSQGRIVVGSNGIPLNSSANPNGYLGKYDPDWTGSLNNELRFHGLGLNVLLDTRQGGSIYSLTNSYGRRSGVLATSLPGREKSADQKDYVVPGVKVVDGDTVPNDIPVRAQDYHRSLVNIREEFTYDASFVKLREVRLGYDLPGRFARRAGVGSMKVSLVGRNLMLWTDVPNIDPETAFNASNVQGFEYSQMPSARSIGFNIVVTP